mgnify:CR=1 FL=1
MLQRTAAFRSNLDDALRAQLARTEVCGISSDLGDLGLLDGRLGALLLAYGARLDLADPAHLGAPRHAKQTGLWQRDGRTPDAPGRGG